MLLRLASHVPIALTNPNHRHILVLKPSKCEMQRWKCPSNLEITNSLGCYLNKSKTYVPAVVQTNTLQKIVTPLHPKEETPPLNLFYKTMKDSSPKVLNLNVNILDQLPAPVLEVLVILLMLQTTWTPRLPPHNNRIEETNQLHTETRMTFLSMDPYTLLITVVQTQNLQRGQTSDLPPLTLLILTLLNNFRPKYKIHTPNFKDSVLNSNP